AMPSSGGWYVYSRRAFGNAFGFSVAWSDWLAQSASVAYLAVSIGDFAAALWPSLAPITKAIALVTLASFAALQWLGLRSSSWVQQATSLIKGAALLVLVALCFLYPTEPGALEAAVSSLRPGVGLAAVM